MAREDRLGVLHDPAHAARRLANAVLVFNQGESDELVTAFPAYPRG